MLPFKLLCLNFYVTLAIKYIRIIAIVFAFSNLAVSLSPSLLLLIRLNRIKSVCFAVGTSRAAGGVRVAGVWALAHLLIGEWHLDVVAGQRRARLHGIVRVGSISKLIESNTKCALAAIVFVPRAAWSNKPISIELT